MSESDNWNIKIQLGNWVGAVTVPKARFPEAKAAHQAVLDTAWNWVEREDELEDDPSDLDPCVECGESTAPGSGRWVNRLAVDGGWECIECVGSVFECDRCGKDIPFDEDTVEDVFDEYADEVIDEVRLGPCCAKIDEVTLTIQVPTTKPRTWAQVQADPRVGSTSDPAGGDEGYWVYLVPSFYSPTMGCRTIHEDTVRAVIDELVKVERCDPDERF